MAGGSPTIRRRRLGRILRELRERAGMTGQAAAVAAERSASWISRVEGGRVGLRGPDLRMLLDEYGLRDPRRRQELAELAREGKQRGWWSGYTEALPEPLVVFIGLESAATSVKEYDNRVVPGLLQTEPYCRAIVRRGVSNGPLSEHEIEARVRVRMARQAQLAQHPPGLQFLLDEAVLYRTIGGKGALRVQLERLLVAGRQSHIDLRVIPFEHGDQTVSTGSYTVMTFDEDPAAVWHETPLGMTYEDGHEEVQTYLSIFEQLNAAALDVTSTAKLIRKARNKLS